MNELEIVGRILETSGTSFEPFEGGLLINVQPRISLPVRIRSNGYHSWLNAEICVPVEEIDDIEGLLAQINSLFGGDVLVATLDPGRRVVSIYRSFQSRQTKRELKQLLEIVDDCYRPLFARVAQTKSWDKLLIALAFDDIEDMPHV